VGLLLVVQTLPSNPSDWVQRWSHLVPTGARVLDVACGNGRHMKWFSERGCHTTGVDRSADAVNASTPYGLALLADVEEGPWPLAAATGEPFTFDVVVVTNYLWRALFPTLLQSLTPGGLLLYETFANGNQWLGKPSRPEFLLQQGELLKHCEHLQIIAYEDGFTHNPDRFVQRIAAIRPNAGADAAHAFERRLLSLK